MDTDDYDLSYESDSEEDIVEVVVDNNDGRSKECTVRSIAVGGGDHSGHSEEDQLMDDTPLDIADDILEAEPESSVRIRDKYHVLSLDEITELMNQSISEIQSVISDQPNNIIRILLNYFNWDQTKLLEKYFDSDKEQLFNDAHIIDTNKPSTSSANKKNKHNELVCLICYNDVTIDDMTSISCGHEFCFYCWRQYLTNKIISEGVCNGISCAQNGCDIIVDDNTITNIIKNEKVLVKYRYLITNSFVSSNRFLRWCPTPDCMSAIKVDNYIEFIPIECKCGAVFCFICGEKWHEPTRCDVLKSWQKKCLGESGEKIDCETANWILSFTKECPKCKAAIEKNGGCNHMTCRNLQCRFEFCWICLADWSKHGYQQSCNKYEESKETQTARARLQRYIHYWTRFHNHQQSLNCEKKLIAEVNNKMEELQFLKMTWVEVQFLMNAFTTLCNCRQTLMYTYPFAYYLKRSNQSYIFEDNQSNLEVMVERLSELMEKDLQEVKDITEMKKEVINISRYVEDRRKVLCDHVVEGYDRDIWEFERLD